MHYTRGYTVSENEVTKYDAYLYHYSLECLKGLTLSVWGCLHRSEINVLIRQFLTYKDGPHTEKIQIFITALDQFR